MFESFAIAEIVKGFLHRGESPRIFFWRDSAGNEIDLVVERGEDLLAFEIKSGKTVSADYFRHGTGTFMETTELPQNRDRRGDAICVPGLEEFVGTSRFGGFMPVSCGQSRIPIG